jgi:tRNA modification GTPase
LDYDALDIIKSANPENVILLINKIDINGNKVDSTFVERFPVSCEISAMTGDGFGVFKKVLVESNIDLVELESGVVFNKVRHRDALRRCNEFVIHAKGSIMNNLSPEFIAMDMRAALDALGEVTGEVTTDEVLNDIFSSFCIGK